MKNLNQKTSTSQSRAHALNVPTAGIRIRSDIRAGEIGRPLTPVSFAGANRRDRRDDRRDRRY
jgi:hypothetical protein